MDEVGRPVIGIGILSAEGLTDAHREVQTIDARSKSDFDAGHIPGAIWMGWEEWCEPAPDPTKSILAEKGYWGALKLASAGWYAERLMACGLRRGDPIVVYADGPQSRGREGRIAWMLLYFGAEAVLLLDGGWQAWLHMGGDVEREWTNPPAGAFPASFQAKRRRTLIQLTASWQTPSRPLFVDTRSAAEFAGDGQAHLPRRGHIPGAVLVPFTTLFDATGRYIDQERYFDGLPSAVRQANDIVAYCEVGVRASLFALLHEAYTGRLVSVWDGSLTEWALTSKLPLQTGTSS